MKKIVCFSGGHSSALAAIETARKYGTEGMVLLNHDISPHVEHEDIKRFKREVAEYIGLPVTYANMPGWETMPPLAVAVANKAFKAFNHPAFCTSRLKTEPFYKWLEENGERGDWVIYGFDAEETNRMNRRSDIMNAMGYKAVFPLADWERTIQATEEVGIARPSTYTTYKHANCIGCLKAGKQHWYCVYCLRPDIWEEAKAAEDAIGYSTIKPADRAIYGWKANPWVWVIGFERITKEDALIRDCGCQSVDKSWWDDFFLKNWERREGEFEPRGNYILREDDGRYTSMDNSHGCAWVETFDTLEGCLQWLSGKEEGSYLDG